MTGLKRRDTHGDTITNPIENFMWKLESIQQPDKAADGQAVKS